MRKLHAIRAEAETFDCLKLLAAENNLTIGDMLDRLVRDEMARVDRVIRMRVSQVRPGGSEMVVEDSKGSVSRVGGKRHDSLSRKKKRGF
jgi:hypothetical protein